MRSSRQEYIIDAEIIAAKLGVGVEQVKKWFKDGIIYEDTPGNNCVIAPAEMAVKPVMAAGFEIGLFIELTAKEAREREAVFITPEEAKAMKKPGAKIIKFQSKKK